MNRIVQRKVFCALTADVVEKRFVPSNDVTPEGWYDNQAAALDAYKEPNPAETVAHREPATVKESLTVEPKRRGRPPKVR